jgi:hypothetical protein
LFFSLFWVVISLKCPPPIKIKLKNTNSYNNLSENKSLKKSKQLKNTNSYNNLSENKNLKNHLVY